MEDDDIWDSDEPVLEKQVEDLTEKYDNQIKEMSQWLTVTKAKRDINMSQAHLYSLHQERKVQHLDKLEFATTTMLSEIKFYESTLASMEASQKELSEKIQLRSETVQTKKAQWKTKLCVVLNNKLSFVSISWRMISILYLALTFLLLYSLFTNSRTPYSNYYQDNNLVLVPS